MADHAFHQVMRHGKAHVGPGAIALIISPRDSGCDCEPGDEEKRLEGAAYAQGENEDGYRELDYRD
jgi:hypothetical protein